MDYFGCLKRNGKASKSKVFVDQHSHFTVMAIRLGVFFYLVTVTVMFGLGSYYLLALYEHRLNLTEYRGLADDLGFSAVINLNRTFHITKLLAVVVGKACSDASQWPHCSALHFPDYIEYIDGMADISPQLRGIATLPILTDDQVKPFEDFAYDFFEKEGHGENSSQPFGISSFGKGIKARNENGDLFHMNESYTEGKHRILVPVLLTGKLDLNINSIMFNIYSETSRVRAVDGMIDCVESSSSEEQAADCGSITDVIRLVQDDFSAVRPAALINYPIYPSNNRTELVGTAASIFNWDVVLEGHVLGGVIVVLKSTYSTFTYRITTNGVDMIGEGDLHDRRYTDLERVYTLTDLHYSTKYELCVYPEAEFASDLPVFGSFVSVFVIVLTSLVVFIYDQYVSRDAREMELIGETKRLFVRYISHEIRTPLNTVHLGLVFLHSDIKRLLSHLSSSVRPEASTEVSIIPIKEWAGLVDEIEESAQIAVTVLNDLINYDKVKMGSLSLEASEVHILSSVHNICRLFLVQAKEKNINLQLEVMDKHLLEMLIVPGDVVKLEQVLRNLICNALKFTPAEGTVAVHLAAVQLDSNLEQRLVLGTDDVSTVEWDTLSYYGNVIVSIKDSGFGMTKANLDSLFQEGVQFNANELQGGKGSGLGLWVSKGFVTRHNGDLTATSEGIHKGSQFTLSISAYRRNGSFVVTPKSMNGGSHHTRNSKNCVLPFGGEDASKSGSFQENIEEYMEKGGDFSQRNELIMLRKDSTDTPSDRQRDVVGTTGAIKNILVVDDSVPNRKMLCRLLSRAGFECCQADDGEAGVKLIGADLARFDLVLMDFEMPVLDGPGACKAIRAMGYNKTILGVTGNVLPADRATFVAAGANDVLHKPLTLSALNSVLEQLAQVGKVRE